MANQERRKNASRKEGRSRRKSANRRQDRFGGNVRLIESRVAVPTLGKGIFFGPREGTTMAALAQNIKALGL
jgi:hypothetical protein